MTRENIHRGTGTPILVEDAIVYDFMPPVFGDYFRRESVLQGMLLRKAPVSAPYMLTQEAYEKLGTIYLKRREILPALECYRVSLDARYEFFYAISKLGDTALLNPHEISATDLSSDLECALLTQTHPEPDYIKYALWVQILREAKKEVLRLNREIYNDEDIFNEEIASSYIDACLAVGNYKEAQEIAKKLGVVEIALKVNNALPREILDIPFLRKYITDNFPESTFGQGNSWGIK